MCNTRTAVETGAARPPPSDRPTRSSNTRQWEMFPLLFFCFRGDAIHRAPTTAPLVLHHHSLAVILGQHVIKGASAVSQS